MKFRQFIPGIVWLIITFILLTLPGDDLPSGGLFDIPFFDKYVHFGMFSILTFLFCYPYSIRYNSFSSFRNESILILLFSIIYGWLMEYYQEYFTIGRAFDPGDIAIDIIGSVAGVLGIWIYTDKKIGPDRNRGRNQN